MFSRDRHEFDNFVLTTVHQSIIKNSVLVVIVCCVLQGLRCSRCLYTQHCAGCVLPRDGSDISLQPGDHLAVQFFDLSESQMDLPLRFIDHSSVKLSRSSDPLTLYDCFHAFTERFVTCC